MGQEFDFLVTPLSNDVDHGMTMGNWVAPKIPHFTPNQFQTWASMALSLMLKHRNLVLPQIALFGTPTNAPNVMISSWAEVDEPHPQAEVM